MPPDAATRSAPISVLVFLVLTGASLVIVRFIYLVFPQSAVSLVGVDLSGAPAAIDVRASYGGTQIGLGLFLLACRKREDSGRAGLVLIFLVGTSLAAARLYGFVIEAEIDSINAFGTAAESGLAIIAALLLRSGPVGLVAATTEVET